MPTATAKEPPGARLSSETSDAYRDREDGPVIGYDTRFDLKLPDRTGADAVASFFRRNLQPEWRHVEWPRDAGTMLAITFALQFG
jgi:hypothetical protein